MRRELACLDTFGRVAVLTVTTDPTAGTARLPTSPGELATLAAATSRKLAKVLTANADVCERGKG
jgi:hypothetical protein